MTKKEFFKKVKANTAMNYHGENFLLIAEQYKLIRFIIIFKAINKVCAIDGYLPYSLAVYRSEVLSKMLKAIPKNDLKKLDI